MTRPIRELPWRAKPHHKKEWSTELKTRRTDNRIFSLLA